MNSVVVSSPSPSLLPLNPSPSPPLRHPSLQLHAIPSTDTVSTSLLKANILLDIIIIHIPPNEHVIPFARIPLLDTIIIIYVRKRDFSQDRCRDTLKQALKELAVILDIFGLCAVLIYSKAKHIVSHIYIYHATLSIKSNI